MSYTIELRPAALRDLKSLPREILDWVSRRISSPADNPRPPGVEKLRGTEDSYRLGVGDFCILYKIQDQVLLVVVVKVKHRREAYR